MFREGQIVVVDCEDSPNHGYPLVILGGEGYNPAADEFDPDYRNAKVLEGPRAGRIGAIHVSHMKVFLNG